jgi:cytochrome P450
MLLAARDDEGNPMSKQQLRDEVITLFIAGHETTANALAWAFYLVAQDPAAEARLLQELAPLQGKPPTMGDLAQLPYSEQVIKEAMRLYPPAGGVTRQPIHDIELGGYPIAKGSTIAISTYVMHHDPALYPDPDRFDPDRFTPENEANLPKYAYLPFGGGPRVCIGNSFALLEARLILLTVLQRFRLHLAPGQTVRAQQVFTLRPKGGLPMRIQAR